MKRFISYNLQLIIVLVGCLMNGCGEENIEPVNLSQLTEGEKAFIPNQPGDTLHFRDENGKKFFLICKDKALEPVSYVLPGHTAPLGETKWDKLTAQFESNIVTDQNSKLSLETRIEGGENPTDPNVARPCNSDYKCSFYLIFKDEQSATLEQIFLGKTDESLVPILVNFNFIPQITFKGQQFHKLNTASISDNCSSVKPFAGGWINSPLGLDSVYYSAQYGLVRLTTVGGKKYQRVL